MIEVLRYGFVIDRVYGHDQFGLVGPLTEGTIYVDATHFDALQQELAQLRKWEQMIRENSPLVLHLTAAEERADLLDGLLLQATPSKVSKCRACGGTSLTWFAQNTVKNGIQQNRLNTNDVTCMFVLGCDDCSETLALVSADKIADCLPVAALKPAEGGGDDGI